MTAAAELFDAVHLGLAAGGEVSGHTVVWELTSFSDGVRQLGWIQRDELGVNRRHHGVCMTQLLLHEQEVSPGPQIGQVTVGVAQKLDAGPFREASRGEDPYDAAVQGGPLVGTAAFIEQQRSIEGGLGVPADEAGAKFANVLLDVQVERLGDVNRPIFAGRTSDEKHRLAGADAGVAQCQPAEFRVAQTGEEQGVDQKAVNAAGKDEVGESGVGELGIERAEKATHLGRFEEHVAGDFPGNLGHARLRETQE